MVRKIFVPLMVVVLTLSLTACDMDSVMSVVDTTNQRHEIVAKGSVSINDTINSKELFKSELASVNNVYDSVESECNIEKIDGSYKDGYEAFIKGFIQFVSNDYKSVENISKLDGYLSSNITDIERKMFDWWGKNINQISETWYTDTIMYNENAAYINTISRIKRDIDGQERDVDIAVKWHICRENGELKIKSASVISLDEVQKTIESVIDNKKDILTYAPSKSQGNEYRNVEEYDIEAANKLLEVYRNCSVTLLSESNEGSGFIVQPGYVMTTYDNIYKAKGIKVVFSDKTEKQIEGVVYASKDNNIAILKMSEKVGTKATFGKSAEVNSGEPVAIIGCAGEMIEHITLGNVYQKDINECGYDTMLVRAPLTTDGIGSAVVNKHGDIVGIVVQNSKDFRESVKVICTDRFQEEINKLSNIKWQDAKCIKLSDMKWCKDNTPDSEKNNK